MATKKNSNDNTILELKKKIAEKKIQVQNSERFRPITNCSINFDGVQYNINAMTKESLVHLMSKIYSHYMASKELEVSDEYFISGYSVENWISDMKAKLAHINRKQEEDKLKAMEIKLHNLLSNEKKIELEIDDIAKLLE